MLLLLLQASDEMQPLGGDILITGEYHSLDAMITRGNSCME
jgi:hypothetical protein